jgi:hypothetical protein
MDNTYKYEIVSTIYSYPLIPSGALPFFIRFLSWCRFFVVCHGFDGFRSWWFLYCGEFRASGFLARVVPLFGLGGGRVGCAFGFVVGCVFVGVPLLLVGFGGGPVRSGPCGRGRAVSRRIVFVGGCASWSLGRRVWGLWGGGGSESGAGCGSGRGRWWSRGSGRRVRGRGRAGRGRAGACVSVGVAGRRCPNASSILCHLIRRKNLLSKSSLQCSLLPCLGYSHKMCRMV